MGNSTKTSSTKTSRKNVQSSNPSDLEINGKSVNRELIKSWLTSKKVTLWSDWCVTEPSRLDLAADWFMKEIKDMSASI